MELMAQDSAAKEVIMFMKDIEKVVKDEDVKHKDYCIDASDANEVDNAVKNVEKEQVIAQDRYQTIEDLSIVIETLNIEAQELEVNKKQAPDANCRITLSSSRRTSS